MNLRNKLFVGLFCLVSAAASTALARPNNKIVGGVEAAAGEFPFIVSLQRGSSHFCGGSLIASDWVLTAAHCMQGATSVTVVIGLHDQKVTTQSEIIQSKRIIVNPNWNSSTFDHDFALIQLQRPSSFPAVRLNNGEINVEQEGLNTVVAGWGVTKEGSWTLPNLLQKVEVPLVSRATCNVSYKNQITDRMICAGFKDGGKDSCQGDSGGPLLADGADHNRYLIGLVSWGTGCARPDYYGVYSNVMMGYAWIQSVVTAPPAP